MKSIFILAIIVIISSCSTDYQGVTPYSPVRVYPNPFEDNLCVLINTSESWKLTFLDSKGKSMKDTSGTSGFDHCFDFSGYKDKTIIVQATIGSDVYVVQALKAGK